MLVQQVLLGLETALLVPLGHDLLLELEDAGDDGVRPGGLEQIFLYADGQGRPEILLVIVAGEQQDAKSGQGLAQSAAQGQAVLARHSDVADENVRTGQGGLLLRLKVGLIVTLCCVVLAAMAGYALSRFKSRIFTGYLTGMLVLQMFPLMLRLIPLFIIFKGLNIQNTHLSLILSYTAINLPFSIMMLKGFFDTISIEIEESAMIDGCGRFQCLVRIVLPLAGAGLATVAIFTFLNVWNEYTFANILVNDPSKTMLTVGLQKYMNKSMNSWGQMMAASTVGMLPSVLFLLFAQRHIVQGMLAGSVKG